MIKSLPLNPRLDVTVEGDPWYQKDKHKKETMR